FNATTRQSAPLRRIGTFGLAVGATCAFSLGIAGQVLTFHTRARLSFTSPACRMPLGQSPGQPPNSSRENRGTPSFGIVYVISTLHQRFAYARLSQPRLPKSCFDFSATRTTVAFDHSSLRWLGIGSSSSGPNGTALF